MLRLAIMIVLTMLVPLSSVWAEGATTGVSVNKFIGPDGRIDLDALRQSGYEGALDTEGFKFDIDPATGEPLVTSSTTSDFAADPDDHYWSQLGSGMDGKVLALTVYDGKLIAGGAFTTAGGLTANRIASWDGSSWSPLGSGMNGSVSALTVYDGKLIVGGSFTTAGGVTVNRIASWDGSNWLPLGSGMNGSVRALTVYDGNLIVGGSFTTAGGVTVNRIASWDGSSWSPLGAGMNASVYALTVYNDNLIAAGSFYQIEPWPLFAFMCIASWDGSSWSQVGSPLWTWPTAHVEALTVYNGALYAGGPAIQEFSGEVCSRAFIHFWAGSDWFSFWASECAYHRNLFTLSVYSGRLVAGGALGYGSYIRSWGGSSNSFGSGTDGPVYAFTEYDADLIVGGEFTMAGDKPAANIASWTKWASCCQLRGDFNQNAQVDILDVDDYIDWLFRSGQGPACQDEADADGNDQPDILDVDYLIDYLFREGPDPVPCL